MLSSRRGSLAQAGGKAASLLHPFGAFLRGPKEGAEQEPRKMSLIHFSEFRCMTPVLDDLGRLDLHFRELDPCGHLRLVWFHPFAPRERPKWILTADLDYPICTGSPEFPVLMDGPQVRSRFHELARQTVASIRISGEWGKAALHRAGHDDGPVADHLTIWLRLLWIASAKPVRRTPRVSFLDPCRISADLWLWMEADYSCYLREHAKGGRTRLGRPFGLSANGDEIKKLRRGLFSNQGALAERSGVRLRTISRAECGDRIDESNLQAIADALEVPLKQITRT